MIILFQRIFHIMGTLLPGKTIIIIIIIVIIIIIIIVVVIIIYI